MHVTKKELMFMNLILELFKAVLFGLVQGITEWLPVSSTGHMILLDELVTLNCTPSFWNTFLVVVQLGSILAVVVLYFHTLNPFSPKKDRNAKIDTVSMWLKIVVAAIPAALIGIPLNDWFEQFNTPTVVAVALIVYGVAFLVLERKPRKGKIDTLAHLTFRTAFLIGVFQVLSLIPGTSRSGSTILGASILGCSRKVASEFSFFLAIPVMFGASFIKLLKVGFSFNSAEWAVLLTGSLVAFLVSLFAIRFLLSYIRKHDFKAFGWYRIALGILVLGYFAIMA